MQDTKERIVGLADELIKTKGFNAFSYKDISDPLEIKNAAIHYYFPGKANLGTAVLEREIQQLEDTVKNWQDVPENEQLQQLIDSFGNKCERGLVCVMGSLSPDYETLPEDMQVLLRRFSSTVLDTVSTCLGNGRRKKLFKFKGEPYDRALLVVAGLLSSLLLSRVMGPTAFERITTQLMKDLQ